MINDKQVLANYYSNEVARLKSCVDPVSCTPPVVVWAWNFETKQFEVGPQNPAPCFLNPDLCTLSPESQTHNLTPKALNPKP